MDAIFDLIGKVFNPILEMGGPVIMLIILTVLALLFGVKFSKALEGGYFRQTKKASDTINLAGKGRALYTSIYFLLEETNPSHFHRLTAQLNPSEPMG
ncbi:PTS system galactitol-specific family transporter subunit IIC [Streptococcus pneumoniae]|nr:PTS system galactitol-specific family transporter subunit IIC [Streptococcus pneumoniae]